MSVFMSCVFVAHDFNTLHKCVRILDVSEYPAYVCVCVCVCVCACVQDMTYSRDRPVSLVCLACIIDV